MVSLPYGLTGASSAGAGGRTYSHTGQKIVPHVHPLVDLHLFGETEGFPTQQTQEVLIMATGSTDSITTTVICQWVCVAI